MTVTALRSGNTALQTSNDGVDLWRSYHRASASDVRALQQALNAQGAGLAVDGRYGPNTRKALEAARGTAADATHTPKPAPEGDWFQRNLPAIFTPPKADAVPDRPSVRLGRDYRRASADDVRALQTYLNQRGAGLEVDGRYGPNTEKALLGERRRLYAPNPGRPNPSRQTTTNPTTPSTTQGGNGRNANAARRGAAHMQGALLRTRLDQQVATPESILSRDYDENTSSKQVRELQTTLRDAGIDPGPIDGAWGRKTRAALTLAKAKGLHEGGRDGSFDLDLAFDGDHLHVKDHDGEIIRSFPARSGLPKGSPAIPSLNKKHGLNLDPNVDYSDPSKQDVAFAGPLPEAKYSLALSEDMAFDKTGARNGAGWGVGGWGMEETRLNRLGGRNGFFLHHDGGTPGTAGCIGLENGEDMKELQALLQHAHTSGQTSLDVKVDYPQTNNGFWDYW